MSGGSRMAQQQQLAPTWPGSAAESIKTLIEQLHGIGEEDAANSKALGRNKTPYSLQVIKAGSTALSRRWAAIVAGAGGLPALWALVQGLTNTLGAQDDAPMVRAAFLLAGSVLLSTAVIAVAIIVRSDVTARAAGTAARAHAEASIAVASLSSYQYAQAAPPPIGPYLLKKNDGTVVQVESFGIANGNVQIIAGGQVVSTNDIDFMFDSRSVKT